MCTLANETNFFIADLCHVTSYLVDSTFSNCLLNSYASCGHSGDIVKTFDLNALLSSWCFVTVLGG